MKHLNLSLMFLLSVSGGCFSLCANTVTQVVQSPKGQTYAVVFTRDCGATTSWATNVSVISQPNVGNDATGNVFIANGGNPAETGVTVEWSSVRNLRISYSRRLDIFKRADQVGKVSISYVEDP